ncbi:metal ABC transporter permease, partial [Pseudomonadota bacterium]
MRSSQAAPPSNTSDWKTIRTLAPYLWAHKQRVLAALACLVVAKIALVTMPWFLKDIVDHLSETNITLTLPLTLLLGYGALRLAGSAFGELRDAI